MSGKSGLGVVVLCALSGLAAGAGVDSDAGRPGSIASRLDPAGAIRSTALYLRAGSVSTAIGKGGLADVSGPAAAGRRFVLQLDGPITPSRRAQMEGAGIELGEYLPMYAYVARLDGADPAKVAALSFVRWHSEFSVAWKLDPEIDGFGGHREFATPERRALDEAGLSPVTITLFSGEEPNGPVAAIWAIPNSVVHYVEQVGENWEISATVPTADAPALASIDEVLFVEPAPEITFRNSTNRWIVQSNVNGSFPLYSRGIHGEGQAVGVLDGRIDRNHCSFAGSKILAYNTANGADFHGTHVGGTAAGDPGSDTNNRGVAYAAQICFDDIPGFSESSVNTVLVQHHNQGAQVAHTNSWGNDGTTSYDSMCRGFDVFQRNNEDSFVCLAVTNLSALKNPENAKNLLAVGASQDSPNQGSHCSGGVGPTSDGRRKPEIYAPGCSTNSSSAGTSCSTTTATGTSMASPAIGGTALLARQYYTDGYYPTGVEVPSNGFTPTGALVKATLLNSAVDMTGITGYPSNLEGWGRVLLDDAVYFSTPTPDIRKMISIDVRNASGLTTGQNTEYAVNVQSGQKLKVTLVWTDVAATAGASFAPVNELDLEVVSPSAQTYKGNVFSGGQSATGGTRDDRNNVEQVHINTPAVGTWIVRVKGFAVNSGTQGFALVVTGDVDTGPAPLSLSLAGSAPGELAPGTPTDFDVVINQGDDTLVGGSAELLVALDGMGFASYPLVHQGGDVYRATIPAATCDDTPAYYVTAEGTTTGVVNLPAGTPGSPFAAVVGVSGGVLSDDFEGGVGGWVAGDVGDTASGGIWELADPQATTAQPGNDHTGAPGVLCWVTDGRSSFSAGAFDVDGGTTTLYSQVFDLTGSKAAKIGYWRWYSNDAGGGVPNEDTFRVDIQNVSAGTWVNAETVGPAGPEASGDWYFHEIDVGSFVDPDGQIRVRFIADDSGSASIVEAAIDDLAITNLTCEDVDPPCAADLADSGGPSCGSGGDGQINTDDFVCFLTLYAGANPAADVATSSGPCGTPDGTVNTDDFVCYLSLYGAGCP